MHKGCNEYLIKYVLEYLVAYNYQTFQWNKKYLAVGVTLFIIY